jgi:hypothetical protein
MVQIQKGMRSGVCEALEAFVTLLNELKATESALEQLIVERTQQRTERGLKALGAVCLQPSTCGGMNGGADRIRVYT